VYEARQTNPDRPVAVKVLAPWLADNDEALNRFWREARVPANLDHPGIVRIISTGKTDSGIAYYAMHLVRGVSLAQLIRAATTSMPTLVHAQTGSADAIGERHTPRPSNTPNLDDSVPWLREYVEDRFATVARIGAQVARALAYAHQQGHLHRDSSRPT
jgi:serine/threonine protein kinase